MSWGAIGSAVAGSVIDGVFNQRAQDRARAASEDMYRNRYQIMVQDMQAAGLNPMLAYTKDPGAPPSIGGGQVSSGTGQAINSARQTSAQSSLMKEQEELLRAQKENTQADTAVKLAQPGVMEADIYQKRASGALSDSQSGQIRALLPFLLDKSKSEAELAELLLPKARNMANAEYTQFKQDISPFLEDAELATRAGANLGRAINPLQLFKHLDMLRNKSPKPNTFKRGPYGR